MAAKIPESGRFKVPDYEYVQKLNTLIDTFNGLIDDFAALGINIQAALDIGQDLEALVGGNVATEADVKKATDVATLAMFI
ncbi:hypothetical protein [Bowmanella denitrificans]|uniref:hypothetical protein n=1 Tax=Bowmanella denitrificans TaxID=366582 RepID=UPI000C9AE8A1|nr:hypothetical protein [Bowmanella denitrificans]